MVKDINPDGAYSYPDSFASVGGMAFFVSTDGMGGLNGYELWKSDGTPAETAMVADIYPGPGSSTPSLFTAVGNTLFFVADDSTHGNELWLYAP